MEKLVLVTLETTRDSLIFGGISFYVLFWLRTGSEGKSLKWDTDDKK